MQKRIQDGAVWRRRRDEMTRFVYAVPFLAVLVRFVLQCLSKRLLHAFAPSVFAGILMNYNFPQKTKRRDESQAVGALLRWRGPGICLIVGRLSGASLLDAALDR